MDLKANRGNFYGPASWRSYLDLIEPEELLFDETNIQVNWEGFEATVGKFEIKEVLDF